MRPFSTRSPRTNAISSFMGRLVSGRHISYYTPSSGDFLRANRSPIRLTNRARASYVLLSDGFFALPEENSEYHPLFEREDVLHLIDSTQEDTITHLNTEHTRALMWGNRGKAIFTTFWPDSLGLDIGWLSEHDVALRKWMKPCTFDEISAMSTLTSGRHKAKFLRWSYIHFGSNAHACLQVSHDTSDADYYLKELERAHDNLWSMQPTLRES
ncbi:hypothetical protein EDB19DRAFT_333724 [Suillus lakei]|nr:hypothetical protein EDB19DRAFT_333724 [Suillus lakei]